jgi:hypothetical protein
MTRNFEKNVVSWLLCNDSKHYIFYLKPDYLSDPTLSIILALIQNYYKKYNKLPSQENFIHFSQQELKDHAASKVIFSELNSLYLNRFDDTEIVLEEIIKFCQKSIILNATEKMDSTDELAESLLGTLGELNNLKNVNKKRDLVDIYDSNISLKIEPGFPTCFETLNSMTASGGFKSPELIVLMGGPKSFKTGTLLNIAIGYLLDGLNVYIADFENGSKNLLIRVYQALLECERKEINSYRKELNQILEKIKKMKGSLKIENYSAHVDSLSNVESDLDLLAKEGWKPDVIFYDYLDLARSSDNSIKDKRLQIQSVYHHSIRMNKKYNTFCFTPSQVGKHAVSKRDITLTDFAEDFGKAMNCHAAFALCRTDEEVQAGIGRIITVVQREGERFNPNRFVQVELDESRMMIREIPSILENIDDL